MPIKESGLWRKKNAPMSKNYRKGGKSYMGGGMTSEEYAAGGPTQPSRVSKKGRRFITPPTIVDGKPMRITRKTPQESKVRKKPGMFLGGKSKLKKSTGKKMTKSERQKFQKDGIPLRTLGKPYEGKVRKKPGMARGGNLNINKRTLAKMTPKQLASDTMSEYFSSKVNESKGRKRGPGMARGGNLTINKKLIAKMTPKQLKSKTMTDYFNSKVSESRKGRKKGPGR